MKKCMQCVLVLGLLPMPALAQSYATFDAYHADVMQARIKAATVQTLALYRQAGQQYEQVEATLERTAREYPKAVGTGGRFDQRYREVEMGNPQLYGVSGVYEEALESALRRMNAGQKFDPASADRFLGEAQYHALLLRQHLALRQRAAQRLDFAAYSSQAGMGYIRISPSGTYRY